MALSTLAQLAEQSKQLTSHIGGLQVPQIKRGIDQIESQSRKLAAKASKPTDGTDNKGYVTKETSSRLSRVSTLTLPTHWDDEQTWRKHSNG